jgi:predicted transcriptional regulator
MPASSNPNSGAPVDEASGHHFSSKVARLIVEYGLDPSFGDRLEELWTADNERRESLRSLADRFNKRLLVAATSDAGTSTLEGEVDNLYRLLTGEEVSSGQRTEARKRLRQNDVDVEQLKKDFVTYQAIRSYLKKYRGADYEGPSEETRIKNKRETIQRLTSRLQSVTENSLSQLQGMSTFSLGEFRVFVEITVMCEDCGSQYGIVELFNQDGCDCGET